jgi:hypothetical protein
VIAQSCSYRDTRNEQVSRRIWPLRLCRYTSHVSVVLVSSQSLRTADDDEAQRVLWIPLAVGVLERAIITTLVGWNVSGSAGFIGGWIAVKSAGGWASWSKGTTYGRSILFVGLLGNAVSILFALAGGLIIATS